MSEFARRLLYWGRSSLAPAPATQDLPLVSRFVTHFKPFSQNPIPFTFNTVQRERNRAAYLEPPVYRRLASRRERDQSCTTAEIEFTKGAMIEN